MSRLDAMNGSLSAYTKAVEKMLTRFHGLPQAEATRRAKQLRARLSPETLLHDEPYLTAAELAGKDAEETNSRLDKDLPEAIRIWDECVAAAQASLRRKPRKAKLQEINKLTSVTYSLSKKYPAATEKSLGVLASNLGKIQSVKKSNPAVKLSASVPAGTKVKILRLVAAKKA